MRPGTASSNSPVRYTGWASNCAGTTTPWLADCATPTSAARGSSDCTAAKSEPSVPVGTDAAIGSVLGDVAEVGAVWAAAFGRGGAVTVMPGSDWGDCANVGVAVPTVAASTRASAIRMDTPSDTRNTILRDAM